MASHRLPALSPADEPPSDGDRGWLLRWLLGDLAFATMIRSAERWCRVSVSDFERHQLKLLRAELGLDPPPVEDHATRRWRTPERKAA